MRQLFKTFTVDDTDILQTAASDMREPPMDGEMRLWIGSDQADGTIEVVHGGINVVEKSNLPVITVGQLKTDGPPTHRWKVAAGVKVVAKYDEVTGGTMTLLLQYFDIVDLLMEAGFGPQAIARMLGQEG